jgi:SAM-dependent methyltransferase
MKKTIHEPELMRRDWNERACADAFHYIASWKNDWEADEFFASGERDYEEFVAPVLKSLDFNPAGKTMLEVGCGVGRMTRALARRFAHVYALDVSAEMLKQAETYVPSPQVTFLLGDGAGFPMLESGVVDFAFSYITLQHVPTEPLVLGIVREMIRVLKPGGVFLFQFNSRHAATMNWKGRLAWSAIDRTREPIMGIDVSRFGAMLAQQFGLDARAAGRTWRGAVVDTRVMLETLWSANACVAGLTGWGTTVTWCWGTRRRQDA